MLSSDPHLPVDPPAAMVAVPAIPTKRPTSAGIVLAAALRALYPPACVACAAPTLTSHGLCGPCWRDAGFLSGLVCDLCGAPLPGEAGDVAALCDDCLHEPRPWSRGRAALPYRGTARTLVLGLKHGDRVDLARAMGGWLAGAAAPLLDDDQVIVPVPLHWTRLLVRRYNQAALLAHAAGAALGRPVLPDALVRSRRTPALGGPRAPRPTRRVQRELGRADRMALLDGAIAPHPRRGQALAGQSVLLIDDVMTTGATLAACATAALEAGARDVRILVLARALRDG